MERDILHDAVTFVEDTQHGDALRHRCHAGLVRIDGRPSIVGSGVGLLLMTAPAGRERQRKHERSGDRPHDYSGIQGS
jgi:hypothetical protein